MIPPDILERLTREAGGRFRITSLLEKRAREICLGAPSLMGGQPERPQEAALQEAIDGKIRLLTPEEAAAEAEAEAEE